ncbi:MAG: hypothetical protein QOH56_2993 [Pseudonocardiales bacterium]|nr:hypothetical protein [Pseudonocardiales bacterium]
MTAQPDHNPAGVSYDERLYSPWWWYPAGLGVAVLLGAEFALAFTAWWAWLPTIALVVICLLVVWRISAGRVTVTPNALTAGDRTIDLGVIQSAIGLTSGELRRLVGRHSDPRAFTFIRSWVGPGVQFVLARNDSARNDSAPSNSAPNDSRDDVPYWVVSTRHPERLLAALEAGSVPVR